jgi:hypothetical protein
MQFLVFTVYTLANKMAVTKLRALSRSSAEKITPILQHAHSELFLQNAPSTQTYGSKSSLYRWELTAEGAMLRYEMDFIYDKQQYVF